VSTSEYMYVHACVCTCERTCQERFVTRIIKSGRTSPAKGALAKGSKARNKRGGQCHGAQFQTFQGETFQTFQGEEQVQTL